jgi:hypothetical protein
MYEEQGIEDQTFLVKSRQYQKIDIETKTVLYFDE